MPSMEELKQKNQSIQMPSQIPMQTQMKAEFITISPDLWASIITWIENIHDKMKILEYKMDRQPSADTTVRNLKEGMKETLQDEIQDQMKEYIEQVQELQLIKWRHIILKGIPIGILLGSLATLLWIK